eukprot:27152-Chlamydomonas_euryale.AAC.1
MSRRLEQAGRRGNRLSSSQSGCSVKKRPPPHPVLPASTSASSRQHPSCAACVCISSGPGRN